ncbi:MAG: ABC transporter permease [Anaerolineae bacterium]|nr:ABC transporter permease [Anaerolineae bacterium]
MLLNLYRYRDYIIRNAWDDLRLRYAGSGIGLFWNFLLPLLQIAIYTIVFSRLVSFRSGNAAGDPYDFVLYLCSGLLPWLAFSGTVTRCSNAFRANARYLGKLPIPEEIFVAQLVLAETFGLMLYLLLLVLVSLFIGHSVSLSSIMLPIVGILFQIYAFGLGLLLASLEVFFHDISHVLRVLMQLWMWTLPIVYVENILPSWAQVLLLGNPPYYYLSSIRDLFLYNIIPNWTMWAGMGVWALGITLIGNLVLHKLRKELRDVL